MSRTERKAPRKDRFELVYSFSYILSLIFRIPLFHLIGEKGIAYFSIANEIYVLTGVLVTYGLSKAVYMLVKYRVKREQFKSSDKVLHCALFISVVIGILSCILILAISAGISNRADGLKLASLAVSMAAPTLIFQMLTGVLKGYFEGNGSRVPSTHSVALKALCMIPAGLIGASLLYQFGIKVSALLRLEDYAAAYGAMGASVGILVVSVLGFVHMLLLFFIYHGRVKRQAARDLQRNQDKGMHIVHMLIGTAVPFAGYAVLFRIIPFLDGVLFLKQKREGVDVVSLWGNYYGKYLVVIGVLSFLVSIAVSGQTKRIIHFMEREEYSMAREKLGMLIHQTALVSFPVAVFTAVLSEDILNVLFKGNNKETALLVSWGSILIVLFVFSRLFSDLLIRMNHMGFVIAYEGAALLVHIVLLIILLNNKGVSLTALIVCNILSFVVLTAAGFLLAGRRLQYKQEWLHSLAFPVIVAAISGIVIMLINRLFSSFAGTTIALFICLPVGIVVYMVLLIVTKTVTEQELQNMQGGGILLQLGRWIRLM